MRRNHTPSQSTDEPSRLDETWSDVHRTSTPLRLPAIPTLVVAPHPDDETLLAGGLIATQRSRGVDVQILTVTDGERAYGAADPALAARRRAEQLEALAELGVGEASVSRLGVADGAAAQHIDPITDAIAAFEDVGLVVAPWTGDHHSDHEAVGAAARDAVGRTGSALVFGLFWTWHRRTPSDVANERMLRLRLDDDSRRRRRRAIERHRSQFAAPSTTNGGETPAPQLTAELVRPLDWLGEYYLSPRPSAVPDDFVHHVGLATGVPPVTSGPSGVHT